MGMSYHEFWHGDNDAPRMYARAYKRRRSIADADAWAHGLYTRLAVISAFAGDEKQAYPKRPLLEEHEAEAPEKTPEKTPEKKGTLNKAQALFEAWAIQYNMELDKQNKERGAENGG